LNTPDRQKTFDNFSLRWEIVQTSFAQIENRQCKFWRGKKSFIDTISQLLRYLTWRDSKAAVIIFVPNKDFTSALEIAKGVINEHPNYLEYQDSNDDRNRQMQLAVMLYHTPR